MPRTRTPALLTLAALALFGIIALLLWRISRPPEIARLLPEADAILFADLRPIRLATHLDRDPPTRSRDYQNFVDATGIVPERDLDQAAFALTRRPDPTGINGPVAYTELFVGRFDPARLERYLRTLTPTTETYTGHAIYVLHMMESTPAPTAPNPDTTPVPTNAAAGRDLRITVVRPGLLAVSNTPTPEQIHAILDHARSGAFLSTAPSLLTDRFPDVPRLSTVWAVGRLGLPLAADGHLTLLGLTLPIPADQSFVLSLRYVGVLRLRIEALTASPDAALEEAGALTSLAGLARSLFTAQPDTHLSPDLIAALDSLRIEPHASRAILTASLPLALARQLTGSAGDSGSPSH